MCKGKNGEPAELLRKVCQVEAVRGATSSTEWERLPVFTLTFATPPSLSNAQVGNAVRIDCGDVIKVVVPGFTTHARTRPPVVLDVCRAHRRVRHHVQGVPERRLLGLPGQSRGVNPSPNPHLLTLSQTLILQVGDAITVFKKGTKERQPGSHVGLVAFGVGITEALPIAAAELAKPEAEQVRTASYIGAIS